MQTLVCVPCTAPSDRRSNAVHCRKVIVRVVMRQTVLSVQISQQCQAVTVKPTCLPCCCHALLQRIAQPGDFVVFKLVSDWPNCHECANNTSQQNMALQHISRGRHLRPSALSIVRRHDAAAECNSCTPDFAYHCTLPITQLHQMHMLQVQGALGNMRMHHPSFRLPLLCIP